MLSPFFSCQVMQVQQPRCEVIGLGQCSLDILGLTGQYPDLDQKAELSTLLVQGGGPVATALVTLARLGVKTAFVGAIGDDDFGQQIRQGLDAELIDCTYLRIEPETSSQVAFVVVDGQGHRNIFWHRGGAQPELPETMSQLLAAPVRVLHLDGLHLEPAIAAAELARTAHVATVLDAGTLRPGLEKLLPLIDHLVVSENFAHQLAGCHDPQLVMQSLMSFDAKAVVVTCGKAGSYSSEPGGEVMHHPAFPMHAVDTTGCGDVFHGGYIYGLLNGYDLKQRVRFATACAALKTRQLGGRTAIPNLYEVELLLQENPES